MIFIHETLSVVEWIAVGVFAFFVIAVLIAFISNLGGLMRYLRLKNM